MVVCRLSQGVLSPVKPSSEDPIEVVHVNDVEDDISTTLHFIAEQADHYMAEQAIDFEQMVQKKRVLFRLEEAAIA